MKLIKFFTVFFMLYAVSTGIYAQEMSKSDKMLLKKQLKEYKSDGWKTSSGQPTLQDQLEESFAVQHEVDFNGHEVWIVGEGRSSGTIHDAARNRALSAAKSQIAQQLTNHMTTTILQDLANRKMRANEAEAIVKTIINQQRLSINRQLYRPRKLIECFRRLPNGNIEVLVRCAISSETVNKLAIAAIQQARRDNLLNEFELVKNQ